ncbi:Putative porin [Paraburkholderia unamae]|nr:porin [Paraburkholderia unamae]CAG9258312.1 Putative porin [Paraburkholderia unamae]
MGEVRKVVSMSLLATGFLLANEVHAQSSVTLYGIADTALLYTSKSLNPQTGANTGSQYSLLNSGSYPSLFGLSGTEDLGGGFQTKFKLESGIDLTNGGFGNSNGNLFGRQAWVSLASPYGELKAGVQFSPLFNAGYATDARGYSMFGSGLVTYIDNVLGTSIFNSNAISYTSPNLWGLQGSVMLAMGAQAGDFQAGRQYGASLIYQNGSLTAAAAFYDGNAGGTVSTVPPTNVAFIGRLLGISYHFGSLTTSASVVNYKVAGSFNNYVVSGGMQYFVLPQLIVDGGVYWTSDRNETTNHSILAAVGAQYLLSKRSAVYTQVGFVNNHGKMNTGLAVNNALYGVTGNTVGVTIGLRHMF